MSKWSIDNWCRQAYLHTFLDSDNTETHEYKEGKCIWCKKMMNEDEGVKKI